MVLLPCIENGDATQGTKLFVMYTKDNNPNNKQPWVPNLWASSLQGKNTIATCMKESKEGKEGKEKKTTLGNPKANASPDDQGVNIKVNMWGKQAKTMKVWA